MMHKPDTFRDLIRDLGGVKAFADKLGVSEFTAKKMRDRSSVAVDHWPRLLMVAREGGYLFTTDDFVAMSAKREVEKRRKGPALVNSGEAA